MGEMFLLSYLFIIEFRLSSGIFSVKGGDEEREEGESESQ
jgi:hypothetical protein